MTRRTDLETLALRLVAILGENDCLLVGGMAVMAHGYVRATQDVDFVVRDLTEAAARLAAGGLPTQRLKGNPLDGEFPCLKGSIDSVRFDVMPPLVPLEWERGLPVRFGRRGTLRVVDLDGLIRLKLRAGGPKDLMDVAALVLRHPERREPAREIAVAYRLGDRLDMWLGDRRLQAEIDDTIARERAASKKRSHKTKR